MFAEDLSVFFSAAEHAADARITPRGAVMPADVVGIFSNAYALVEASGMEIAGTAPNLKLPTADVPCSWRGASVCIASGPGAGSYTVAEHHPDGTGVSVLVLQQA